MVSMDVAKDPAVKMKVEDLAHAYDAVRVANKSVTCVSTRFSSNSMLPFIYDVTQE